MSILPVFNLRFRRMSLFRLTDAREGIIGLTGVRKKKIKEKQMHQRVELKTRRINRRFQRLPKPVRPVLETGLTGFGNRPDRFHRVQGETTLESVLSSKFVFPRDKTTPGL